MNAIGYLGKDAEIIGTNEKKQVAFNLAVNKKYVNAKGESIEQTTWLNCYCYFKSERVLEFLKKGVQLHVTGTPSFAVYESNAGEHKVNVYLTVTEFNFISTEKKQS